MRHQNPSPIRPPSFAWIALVGFALSPIACGGGAGKVNPVRGEVFVNGQPAVGALVTLRPLQAAAPAVAPTDTDPSATPAASAPRPIPTATVDADGSFRLTTFAAYDGAPAGDYAVTVTWCDSRREDGETVDGPDKLRWRYASPAGSGLKATVKPGKNQLPRFDLN